MDDVLRDIGFTPKEASIYLCLLENGQQTAASIARACGEKRANTYMILESLIAKQVIVASDEAAVRTFAAGHPSALQRLLRQEQDRQAQVGAALGALMPSITSKYNLSSDRPGVTYMQGSEGFITLLTDMARSNTEVLLLASNQVPMDDNVLIDFRKLLQKRKNAGIKTRAIFHHDTEHSEHDVEQFEKFKQRGIDLRFLGDTEFTGEVAIYENNVAFTVYQPSLVVTVVTNSAIAATMRTVFEQLWEKAER